MVLFMEKILTWSNSLIFSMVLLLYCKAFAVKAGHQGDVTGGLFVSTVTTLLQCLTLKQKKDRLRWLKNTMTTNRALLPFCVVFLLVSLAEEHSYSWHAVLLAMLQFPITPAFSELHRSKSLSALRTESASNAYLRLRDT